MRAQEVVERALDSSVSTAAVVGVDIDRTKNARWAMSRNTTNGDCAGATITFTAMNERDGEWSAATRQAPLQRWREAVEAADAAVRDLPPATDGRPLQPGEVAEGFGDDPALDVGFDLGDAVQRAAEAHPALRFHGYAEASVTTTYVGTSAGAHWRHVQRHALVEQSAGAERPDRSAWAGSTAADLGDIDIGADVAQIISGVDRQSTRDTAEAGPTRVILTPSAVADLVLCLWWEMNARDAAEGRSPLSGSGLAGTALGRRVSPRSLDLTSDPFDATLPTASRLWSPWSSSAVSVFDTGVELAPVSWLRDGMVQSVAAPSVTAERLGLPRVLPVGNLRLQDADGTGSLADLVGRTDDALLITSLWYIRHVDLQQLLVTGLTRDGVYRVRAGEVTGAVGNFRFNESPLGMLSRITDAAEPVRCLPREWSEYPILMAMPPLVIDDFGLSTVSSAV